MQTEATVQTYTKQRLDALGITRESMQVTWSDENFYEQGPQRLSVFATDDDDNLVIRYPSLDEGEPFMGSGTRKGFKRYEAKRLKEPKGGMKYQNPFGESVRVFIPLEVVAKFRETKHIHTLVVTEGQLKAWKGSMHGLNVLGLAGIHNFKENGMLKLDNDIVRIVQRCGTANLVLLFDADCKRVTYKDRDSDVSKRLSNFCKAASRFVELAAAAMPTVKIYFSHIKPVMEERAKGLDDLMTLDGIVPETVANDLLLLDGRSRYFDAIEVREAQDLKRYFCLHSAEAFYGTYQDELQDYEFTYKRGCFRFDNDSGKLLTLRHPDCAKYMRVGIEWFKHSYVLDKTKKKKPYLAKWSKVNIQEDHKHQTGFNMLNIPRYDGFINMPENDPDKYSPFWGNQYNKYRAPIHRPEEGDWSAIQDYLKHAFGEEIVSVEGLPDAPRWIMALDWINILYVNPTHKLPIIALVSEKTGTGKSTFLFLMQAIFGENGTVIGNEELTSSFNGTYIDRVFVGIDEGFIEKKVVMEKLKSYNTAVTAYANQKMVNQMEIDAHMHFALTSNDERNFAHIDDQDSRFWVIKVPQIAPHRLNSDMLDDMKMQIPAFLHELKTRKIFYPRKDRFWFNRELLNTAEKREVQLASVDTLHQSLSDLIADYFLDFPQDTVAYFCIKHITDGIKPLMKYGVNHFVVKNYLARMGYAKPITVQRRPRYVYNDMEEFTRTTNEPGRYYEFHARDFLDFDTFVEAFGKSWFRQTLTIPWETFLAQEYPNNPNTTTPAAEAEATPQVNELPF